MQAIVATSRSPSTHPFLVAVSDSPRVAALESMLEGSGGKAASLAIASDQSLADTCAIVFAQAAALCQQLATTVHAWHHHHQQQQQWRRLLWQRRLSPSSSSAAAAAPTPTVAAAADDDPNRLPVMLGICWEASRRELLAVIHRESQEYILELVTAEIITHQGVAGSSKMIPHAMRIVGLLSLSTLAQAVIDAAEQLQRAGHTLVYGPSQSAARAAATARGSGAEQSRANDVQSSAAVVEAGAGVVAYGANAASGIGRVGGGTDVDSTRLAVVVHAPMAQILGQHQHSQQGHQQHNQQQQQQLQPPREHLPTQTSAFAVAAAAAADDASLGTTSAAGSPLPPKAAKTNPSHGSSSEGRTRTREKGWLRRSFGPLINCVTGGIYCSSEGSSSSSSRSQPRLSSTTSSSSRLLLEAVLLPDVWFRLRRALLVELPAGVSSWKGEQMGKTQGVWFPKAF